MVSPQPQLWNRNATIRCATAMVEQHRTHGQAAKHSTALGEDAGVADAIQPAETAETPPQAPRVGQKPQRDRAGEDQAAGARSTEATRRGEIDRGDARGRWRRTAARPMNRRGQMEELGETKQMPRMAMAQLTGARRNRAA
jgi:hypothetical protein